MIDIHAHILPGIDDGAKDIYETVEMAACAAKNGTIAIVATPHVNFPGKYDNYFGEAYIEAYEKAVNAVRNENIPVDIYPGMEVFATYNLPDLLVQKKIMPLNQSRYVLIEFGFKEDPAYFVDILTRVKAVGAKPIIAHAERYECIQNNPQLAYDWRQEGHLIQVNKASFEGKFGSKEKNTAFNLLEHNLVTAIASDAHGTGMRTTNMADVYELLGNVCTQTDLDMLFYFNPDRICQNQPTLFKKPVPFSGEIL